MDGEQPCATQDPPAAPGVGWGWGVSDGKQPGQADGVSAGPARKRSGPDGQGSCAGQAVRTLHYLWDTGQEATWRHSRAATDGAVLWREGGGDQRPSSGSCEEQDWAVGGGVRGQWAPTRTKGYGMDCVSGGSDL